MTKQSNSCTISNAVLRFMLAMVLGVFLSAFAAGASTVHAADDGQALIEEEAAPLEEGSSDDGGGAMIILMGGMLLIILAVVISVVSAFVSTAAIVDEL